MGLWAAALVVSVLVLLRYPARDDRSLGEPADIDLDLPEPGHHESDQD